MSDEINSMKSLLLSVVIVAGGTVHAATVVGELQKNIGDVLPSPVVAVNDDLLQTDLYSVTGEPSTGAVVRDGVSGTARDDSETHTGMWISNGGSTTTTYNLDISKNRRGYDIQEIRVFTGWDSNRAQAGYDLYYSVVGDTNFVFLGTVASPTDQGAANSEVVRMFMTRTYNDEGGNISELSGIDAIQFRWDFSDGIEAGRGPVIREIDVLGRPVENPEPILG